MHSARLHVRQVFRSLWNIGRLAILLPVVILEPIVVFVLGGLALLGLLTTAFFKLVAAPHFPAGTMLLISISWALALVLYEGIIRIVSD